MIGAWSIGITRTENEMRYPTMKQIREAADDALTIWRDDECGCYRADTKDGFTVEDLHGLVSVYADGSKREMGEARKDLLDRLEDAEIAPCDPENENCQSNGCFTLCDFDGCEEKAEEMNPQRCRCINHCSAEHQRWLRTMGLA